MRDATADKLRRPQPCRLGYEEHDGSAYCFEHGGFALVVARIRKCDRAGTQEDQT